MTGDAPDAPDGTGATSADGESLFSLSDVDAGYGNTQILRDVSLRVGDGEVVSLIGRNGVGKTTLMRTAIGHLAASRGAISFRGRDVTGATPDARARLGMGFVPQNRDVFPRLSVRENLAVGELVNADRDGDPLYEAVYRYFPRLEEREDQRAGTLSGGEQQMLAIGRALVGDPILLLLDEPSEGIQPSIVQSIGEAVEQINAEMGTAVFFVEQNLEFTADVSDRCYVMEKGRVVENLPASELRESPVVQQYLTV